MGAWRGSFCCVLQCCCWAVCWCARCAGMLILLLAFGSSSPACKGCHVSPASLLGCQPFFHEAWLPSTTCKDVCRHAWVCADMQGCVPTCMDVCTMHGMPGCVWAACTCFLQCRAACIITACVQHSSASYSDATSVSLGLCKLVKCCLYGADV